LRSRQRLICRLKAEDLSRKILPRMALRVSMVGYKVADRLVDLPLYAIDMVGKIICIGLDSNIIE